MKLSVRSLILSLAPLTGSFAFAQPASPYPVTISGQVLPCDPVNGFVNIHAVQNTQPAFDMDVPLNADCSYSVTVMMDNPQGWFQVGAPCSGSMQYVTGSYQVGFFDTTAVVVNISCGSGNCLAEFTVQQAFGGGALIPWQITTTNQSTGPAPIIYAWLMPDGSASAAAQPTFTFTEPGVYGICLTISADSCTSFACDTVVVDSMGYISTQPVWYDCLGTLWGSALIGTPCDDGNPITSNDTWSASCICVGNGTFIDCLGIPGGPNVVGSLCTDTIGGLISFGNWDANCVCIPGTFFDCLGVAGGTNLPGTACSDPMTGPGTWNANCTCVPDSSTTTCNAGFWVIQAYDSTSTGVEPIPNEVWVWNLSSGGNGTYQFLWNFGDGTTSTDAYPTHEYGSNGPWNLCLTMYSGGCTDSYCDSVGVDANGILNQLVIGGGNGNVAHETTTGARSGGFTLNVIQQITSGISENPAFAELKAWPNPVLNELNISFKTHVSGTVPVTVIDPSGRAVIAGTQQLVTGSNTFRIPTTTLEPGLYMVRIGNDARSITRRFLKVR